MKHFLFLFICLTLNAETFSPFEEYKKVSNINEPEITFKFNDEIKSNSKNINLNNKIDNKNNRQNLLKDEKFKINNKSNNIDNKNIILKNDSVNHEENGFLSNLFNKFKSLFNNEENKIGENNILNNELEDKIVNKAFDFLETPYYFGNKENTFDCSSFVQKVYNDNGITLPRTALEQSNLGKIINIEELKKGDLLFFETYKLGPSHVGIYIGDNKMIHSSSTAQKVIIDSFSNMKSKFLFAKRLNF